MAIGQVWVRKTDGVEIRVTGYESVWEDVSYRSLATGRLAAIFRHNLVARYDLKPDAIERGDHRGEEQS